MSFDYAKSKATADRLIARFGQSGTLERPTSTGPTYNPTPGAPDEHSVTFAVLDYTVAEIDGTRVLATDKKALLAKGSLTIEPTTSDLLVIGGVGHKILTVKPLSPGGVVVLYELQVRR